MTGIDPNSPGIDQKYEEKACSKIETLRRSGVIWPACSIRVYRTLNRYLSISQKTKKKKILYLMHWKSSAYQGI